MVLKEYGVRLPPEFNWLRIWSSGGLFWTC